MEAGDEVGRFSAATIKLRLAALSRLFRVLVAERMLVTNPPAAGERPRHSVTTGTTPVIDAADLLRLLSAIDTSTLIACATASYGEHRKPTTFSEPLEPVRCNSEPHIRDAATVAWQIVERDEAIEVLRG